MRPRPPAFMRRRLSAAFALSPLTMTGPASSQSSADAFPQRGQTIRLIVPWGPGGMVDVVGRALAHAWDVDWGTTTVVINKPGANGQLGLVEMLAARSDGLTAGLTHNWDTQVSYLDPEARAPYHRASFVPVGLIQQTGPVALVRADSPYRNLRDLVSAARARPGQITYATSGPRAESTRIMRLLDERHGARFNLVSFKDVPSSVTALLGGHLDVAGSNVAVALPHVKAGTARVLTAHEVTGQPGRRNPFFPDVPTSRMEGFDIDLISSTGLSLPRGVSRPVVDAWARGLERALGSATVRNTMQAAGVAIAFQGPDAYAAHWQEADAKVRRFLIEGGVKVREG